MKKAISSKIINLVAWFKLLFPKDFQGFNYKVNEEYDRWLNRLLEIGIKNIEFKK